MTGADALHDLLVENAALVNELITHARGLSSERWSTPRAPGKWAPAQELAHLELSYAGFSGEVRDGPIVDPGSFAPRIPELRTIVLPRILAGRWFPSGASSPKRARPPAEPGTQDDVLNLLGHSVAEFEEVLRAEHAARPGRYVRHPYFGALTLSELVRVAIEHTRHHAAFVARANF